MRAQRLRPGVLATHRPTMPPQAPPDCRNRCNHRHKKDLRIPVLLLWKSLQKTHRACLGLVRACRAGTVSPSNPRGMDGSMAPSSWHNSCSGRHHPPVRSGGCSPAPSDRPKQSRKMVTFSRRVSERLRDTGVSLRVGEIATFADRLYHAGRNRLAARRRWQDKSQNPSDMVHWVQEARDSGDRDEAIWRCFLAAHFGWASADPDNSRQVQSAARFLCAFGKDPRWTWATVSSAPQVLHNWLNEPQQPLVQLGFGEPSQI